MTPDRELQALPTTRGEALRLLAAWASGLCVAALVLVLVVRDLQPPPATGGPSAWHRWAAGQDPDHVVVALLAPLALAVVVGTVALVVAAGAVVATAARCGRPVRCPERWPAAASSVVTAVALLAGGAVAPAAGATTGSGAQAGAAVSARPVVSLDGVPAPAPTPAPAPAPALPPPTAPTPPRPDAGPSRSTTYVVQAGDNLWDIAEQQVALQPALGPTVRYWLQLIDANRSRFVEPGNPHLILPGQELALPGQ